MPQWSKNTQTIPVADLVISSTHPSFELGTISKRQGKQWQQGNQRWQIHRPATCQCLATFTPWQIFERNCRSSSWEIRHWIVTLDVCWRGMTPLTWVTFLFRHWPTGIDISTNSRSIKYRNMGIGLVHVTRRTRKKWRYIMSDRHQMWHTDR